ncbi:hypothetical protein PDESU_02528 [Pontiella desulfatans]|uniref:PEP-CTERM protein-sorting domain-containing protein n=1 Tax=Pontiella desulfatans TaxID=2750659 RepID=A0A6C2U332_PONDE|nr:PEP-CTERM sorting domain-containing protein [Pontiella desulfatans]VGO13971.1 hypothetical protein PDESU_02528 [Pontiella desulfatans]
MKSKCMKIVLLGLIACAAGQLQAGVVTLYTDDFTAATDANLLGRTPGGTLGSGAGASANTWLAREADNPYTTQVDATDDVVEYFQNPTDGKTSNGLLAFAPEAGKVYALTADLDNNFTGLYDSVRLGFTSASVSNNFGGGTSARIYTTATGDFKLNSKLEGDTAVNVDTTIGNGTMQMVLDTTAAQWAITASWQSQSTGEFVEFSSHTYTVNPTDITHVGFGFSNGNGNLDPVEGLGSTVDNFSLTVIPEPTTLGLLSMVSGTLLFIRRRLAL